MKKTSIILIAFILLANISAWINYALNYKPKTVAVKCYVLSKTIQDRVEQHKYSSEIRGFNRIFLVKSDLFGYGDVAVTVNTYMTTKEHDTVIFNMDWWDVKNYFKKDIFPPFYLDLSILLLYSFVSIIIIGMFLLDYYL